MIYELLAEGRENARTARELSTLCGCTTREITAQIERERRDGFPICAATGGNAGYFIPETDKELEEYCDQLKGRAIEIFKTRQALIKVLRGISTQTQEVKQA